MFLFWIMLSRIKLCTILQSIRTNNKFESNNYSTKNYLIRFLDLVAPKPIHFTNL
jgi:hypothetical protein